MSAGLFTLAEFLDKKTYAILCHDYATLACIVQLGQCDTNVDLYDKNITIISDTSKVFKMTIVTDAPRCGIPYDCHSDNSRGVIYPPREHL